MSVWVDIVSCGMLPASNVGERGGCEGTTEDVAMVCVNLTGWFGIVVDLVRWEFTS